MYSYKIEVEKGIIRIDLEQRKGAGQDKAFTFINSRAAVAIFWSKVGITNETKAAHRLAVLEKTKILTCKARKTK